MDLTLMFTIIGTGIGSVAVIAALNVSLISWLRSDMKSFETEIRGWKDEIGKQMTDFHGRLCALEEKSRIPPISSKSN